jgi:hypothetical protein
MFFRLFFSLKTLVTTTDSELELPDHVWYLCSAASFVNFDDLKATQNRRFWIPNLQHARTKGN